MPMTPPDYLFKISAASHTSSVAGAIAKSIRDGHDVTLQAIGAGAVNQAVKSIAVARGYLAGDGLDIVNAPSFIDIDVEGNERTAIRFHITRPADAARIPHVPSIAVGPDPEKKR